MRSNKPRALLVVPMWPAPSGNGVAMRAHLLLSALARDHRVDVWCVPVAGVQSGGRRPEANAARSSIAELETDPGWILASRAGAPALRELGRPSACRFVTHRAVADLHRDFGPSGYRCTLVYRSYLLPFVEAASKDRGALGLRIVDLDDDEATTRRRLAELETDPASAARHRLEAELFERFEAEHLPWADHLLAAQDSHARRLRRRLPDLGIDVLPNAVHVPRSSSAQESRAQHRRPRGAGESRGDNRPKSSSEAGAGPAPSYEAGAGPAPSSEVGAGPAPSSEVGAGLAPARVGEMGFRPPKSGASDEGRATSKATSDLHLLFVGTLSYLPNRAAAKELAEEILPLLRRGSLEVRLRLIGRRPPPDIALLARLQGVELVTDALDLEPHYAWAHQVVLPLRAGGGTRIKILEAFAAGVPVVATAMAADGLRVQDGEELLIAESAEALAEASLRLLRSPDLAGSMARRAFRWVRRHHDRGQVADRLADRIAELCGSNLLRSNLPSQEL
ncbi:MAG: glycosyltransferase [Acidobacteriota bacterium]